MPRIPKDINKSKRNSTPSYNATILKYVKHQKLLLKTHPDFNEKWVQEKIAEDPSILGIGELILKDKERNQPGAGRLDLLFQDPDSNLGYEVEIQLGKTDESHIFRTIEYWDLERKRYHQYDHVAVFIAEDITRRFLNIISLLNVFIPLVAIQLNAIQVADQIALIFTVVLDYREGLAPEEEEGLSNHAVHVTHKTLRVAMNDAIKLGLIGRNPCSGTTPPKPEQTEMKFYDDQEVKCLLKTAREIGDKLYPLYFLAIHTGMRQSELVGLKWEDVDWNLNTVQVKRQVRHFKGGSYTFLEPKSKSGVRTIVLGKQALEILRNHKEDQEKIISSSNGNWTSLDLVFPSRSGTPLTTSNIRKAFRKLLKASGLPQIRFHDLRHTAASLMLNHDIPVLIVSKRLGHSKPNTTIDVYGHLIPSRQEEAAQLMDSLMFDG